MKEENKKLTKDMHSVLQVSEHKYRKFRSVVAINNSTKTIFMFRAIINVLTNCHMF